MKNKPDEATREKWLNDKANWYGVYFYYNPADKRILPPKRFGGGWTINWANPLSIIITFGITGAIIAIIVILKNRF